MLEVRKRQNLAFEQRGDWMKKSISTSRRILLSGHRNSTGFSLIELVITITVLTIMTLGVMPLVKISVRRQKEQQLRDALRQMRSAIDEFHRDSVGMVCTGAGVGQQPPGSNPPANIYIDGRSKVVITDCTIFGVDNPDHFPPTLETLIEGVNVMPRNSTGGIGDPKIKATDLNSELAT